MSKTGLYGENTEISHLPGSDGWPFFGHTFDLLKDTYGFSKKMREQYGEVYRVKALFQNFIVFASPEGAEFVLKDEKNNFSSKLGWEPFLGRLFPHSLPTMDGEEHRYHRRIMQSAFKKEPMVGYTKFVDEVVQSDMPNWNQADPIQAYPKIKALALDISAKVFLGLNFAEDADYINKTFITINNGLLALIPYAIPPFTLWRALRAREKMFKYFGPMIPQRRQSTGSDILTRLCQAKDEDGKDFTDQAILYHLINVIAAAHDTSTTSLTMTLHFLTQYPEWQERLRNTCLALNKTEIGYDDLDSLEEIEWVFREVLRIYPPAVYLIRRSFHDCDFNGYHIPGNTQVIADAAYIHRSELYWTDPMKFDPERFSPDRAEHKKHQYLWFPFGGGSHTCIGLRFAMMAAKIILFHLLTRYRFEKAYDGEVNFVVVPITKPKNGLPLKVTPLD